MNFLTAVECVVLICVWVIDFYFKPRAKSEREQKELYVVTLVLLGAVCIISFYLAFIHKG